MYILYAHTNTLCNNTTPCTANAIKEKFPCQMEHVNKDELIIVRTDPGAKKS